MDYGLRIMLGGGILIWIIPIFLIGLITLSLYMIFKGNKPKYDNSLKILKERLVKGEISEEEYYNIKKNLIRD